MSNAALEAAIEAPWIAMAHRLSLTPHTEGPLAMVGERSGLPLSVDMIGPGAATITVNTDLSPGAGIRRRERGQTGGARTGNPIADQLLVVSEGLAEALATADDWRVVAQLDFLPDGQELCAYVYERSGS